MCCFCLHFSDFIVLFFPKNKKLIIIIPPYANKGNCAVLFDKSKETG